MKHFSDLSFNDVLTLFDDVDSLTITEKFDGTNLSFGNDDVGFFIKVKSLKDRIYDPSLLEFSFLNQDISIAFEALQLFYENHKLQLPELFEIECELLLGDQPNTVQYQETNQIVLLRTMEGDIDFRDLIMIDESINLGARKHYSSTDGKTLYSRNLEFDIRVYGNPYLEINISKFIQLGKNIESFLNSTFVYKTDRSLFEGLTKKQWLSVKLNKCPDFIEKEVFQQHKKLIKDIRSKIEITFQQTLENICGLVCSNIINENRLMRGQYEPFIEGFVIGNNDITVKFVNKKIFTIANQFNWSVRNRLYGKPNSFKQICNRYLTDIKNLEDKQEALKRIFTVFDKMLRHYHIKRTRFSVHLHSPPEEYFLYYEGTTDIKTLEAFYMVHQYLLKMQREIE